VVRVAVVWPRVQPLVPLLALALGCASHVEETRGGRVDDDAAVATPARPRPDSSAKPWSAIAGGEEDGSSACPSGMQLVDTSYCPEVRRTCLHSEYSSSNKITLCHAFAETPPTCLAPERRVRFCIDRYEYPNREGAKPPVMVDFYDAMAMCSEQGKRLCWEGEWIAACEGPKKTPFPYGYARDPKTCNIDNPWLKPSLDAIYSLDRAVFEPELTRLDQGVPSGARPGCKSGFDVHDQTGNVDEWVMLEKKRGKGGWAGLKGGAWGHVRNACRPVTTSHAAEFTYYFVSLRCCADAKPMPGDAGPAPWTPPPIPAQKKPAERLQRGFSPPVR
jgi:hypothetical protein